MELIKLLTNIATTTHFNLNIEELIASQPQDIQAAFLNNDGSVIKSRMPESQVSADRTTISSW